MDNEKDKQYIPYLILEDYLRKKYIPYFNLIDYFANYVAYYFNEEREEIVVNDFSSDVIKFMILYRNYNIYIYKDGKIECFLYDDDFYRIKKTNNKLLSFQKSKKTKENIEKYIIPVMKNSSYTDLILYRIPTNYDNLFVSVYVSSHQKVNLDIYVDHAYYGLYRKTISAKKEEQFMKPPIICSKKPRTKEEIEKRKKADSIRYSEEELGKIITSLKVDISVFPKEEQDKIKQFYVSNLGGLDEEKEKTLSEFRERHLKRIMLAYDKFKEIIEIINETKMELQVEKVRVENLRNVIFKNNGIPTDNGYIEFDDFFKNNMVLRMIDLGGLDLSDVNITNMDFSGTNVHIDPQTIYNRDMTGVNALGLHFSPFSDCFDGVILDGTKINDYEAMIDLDRVKSYNNKTLIRKEVVSKII